MSRIACPLCCVVLQQYVSLRSHIDEVHNVKIQNEVLHFNCFQDFTSWKINEETESKVSFVQYTAPKIRKDGKRYYFVCHRSYKEDKRASSRERKNQTKSQGTNKIGVACPATITVTDRNENGIDVLYFKTHLGHEAEIGRLRINQIDRREIAGKLNQGVPYQRILDDIRDETTSSETFTRLGLIEKRDLYNIVRDFKITYSTKRHADDSMSVKLWVEEMKEENNFVILFYKEQNTYDEDNASLKKEDFVLIIMTEFQRMMLLKFGKCKVCIDGTHGLNNYDFILYTLLVIDEYSNGCPVAFMFSNREDTNIFELLFSCVKEVCGEIISEVFMSDDAPAFYNAWEAIMGAATYRLLCTWHVDKNWKDNIRSKIKHMNPEKKKEKQDHVNKTLKALVQETDEEKFRSELSKFLEELLGDESTVEFGIYFRDYYANRPELWAYCYRLHLGINTNTHLEALHRVIKYCYLDGKKVKRLDQSIDALLKVARDFLFKRLTKLAKNKEPAREKKIRESHERSKRIISVEKGDNENCWFVKSEKRDDKYKVEKTNEDCSLNFCPFRCQECNICVHSYKCSCLDNIIRFNICKHIHACIRMLTSTSNDNETGEQNRDLDLQQRDDEFFNALVAGLPQKKLVKNPRDSVMKKFSVIQQFIPELDDGEIIELEKGADKLLSICNRKRPLKEVNEINVRSKIEKQNRFYSTRKKNKTRKVPFSNPTEAEKIEIRNGLLAGQNKYTVISTNAELEHAYF